MASKRKPASRVHVKIRLKPDVLKALRQGAAYHEIGYQTYLQWILEEGLKSEARYYGWSTPLTQLTVRGPTKTQEREIRHLMQVAKRDTTPRKIIKPR